MSETLDLTILHEDGQDGWIVASIPAVAGALSQGHSRKESRDTVLYALALMLSPEPGEQRERAAPRGRVNREKLERHLREHGCRMLDQGGNPTRRVSQAGCTIGVPAPERDRLEAGRVICKQLEIRRRSVGDRERPVVRPP